MKALRKLSLFLAALLTSSAALADIVVNPNGGNVWEILVFGNATAVAEVLKGITLMMAPSESGGSGFRSLMVFMALLGFLVSMIQAVADPGKNLLKAFTYILVAWMISYFTVTVKANVSVIDQLSGHTVVVDRVPAIAALPASAVSSVGAFLTKEFERNLSIPNSFKLSESGQAMLFSRVMKSANEIRISDPEILRSMQAYVANCTVPAIARNKLSLHSLTQSSNFVKELEQAGFNAVLTSFYPSLKNFGADKNNPGINGGDKPFDNACLTAARDADGKPIQMGEAQGNQGILLTCKQAYQCLRSDLENFARAVLDADASHMSRSGVNVTLEQAMSDALALQSRGQGFSGQFSSPNGYVMQRAAISTLDGAFRAAAVRTGNNEYLQAAALAQAETQQRSSWQAAAHGFKNVMGYIYIVLQTFVFAIVPVVVIALFIPGAGMGIAKNYFQVLIWLVLWMPLLAVVNFLTTLFAVSDLSGPFATYGGLSVANSGVISEKAAALTDAADFLAASIPMFTWGIVKGSMAFTEFISHGLGLNYAQQAGATATSGNLSMNNMSMDSFNANKFSNVMTSATGANQVVSNMGAGSGYTAVELGGGGVSIANSAVQSTRQLQEQFQRNLSSQLTASEQKSIELSSKIGSSLAEAIKQGENWSKQDSKSHDAAVQFAEAFSRGASREELARLAQAYNETRANNFTTDNRIGYGASIGADGKVGIPGVAGISLGARGSVDSGASSATQTAVQAQGGTDVGRSSSESQRAAIDQAIQDIYRMSVATSHSSSNGWDNTWTQSRDQTLSQAHALQAQQQASEQLSQALSTSRSMSINDSVYLEDIERLRAQHAELQDRIAPSLVRAAQATAAVEGKLAGNDPIDAGMYQAGLAAVTGPTAPGRAGRPAVGAYADPAGVESKVTQGRAELGSKVKQVQEGASADVRAAREDVHRRGGAVKDHATVPRELLKKTGF